MDYIKERDERFSKLDELVGELGFYFDAYANGSIIKNVESSDVDKTKRMLEITQEIYVIENELAVLEKVIYREV